MDNKQLVLRTWAEAIGGAIYHSFINAAKQLENSNLEKQPYFDEE